MSVVLLAGAVVVLASWGNSTSSREVASHPKVSSSTPLPAPSNLKPFGGTTTAGLGSWHTVGRPVDGTRAIYETSLIAPGGTEGAGVAWMDTRLMSARLYSGSLSPGNGSYRFIAPILPAYARTLVAAFNGGFIMNAAHGGYYTEGRVVDPLQSGAASFVIYANGDVNIGAWGSDVSMTSSVVSVRQNLVLLVANGRLTATARSANWQAWGATCGVYSCAKSVPGIEHQWRSGVGITANGALVYVTGPALSPFQLAELLVRARVVRGMELDINSDWPDFSTYDPSVANGLASPSNGSKLLASTVQGPWTFFETTWARDFVTMSSRS
jgi:hypothetical protein